MQENAIANNKHFELNSAVLNMPMQIEDSAIKDSMAFNIYFISRILFNFYMYQSEQKRH